MKFLNSADKVRVLRIARQKGSVLYEGKRVMFFPDFSVELCKQRRLFDPVKKNQLLTLRIPDLRFGFIYPARMLITFQGDRHIFVNPSEASSYVQQLKPNGQENVTT